MKASVGELLPRPISWFTLLYYCIVGDSIININYARLPNHNLMKSLTGLPVSHHQVIKKDFFLLSSKCSFRTNKMSRCVTKWEWCKTVASAAQVSKRTEILRCHKKYQVAKKKWNYIWTIEHTFEHTNNTSEKCNDNSQTF